MNDSLRTYVLHRYQTKKAQSLFMTSLIHLLNFFSVYCWTLSRTDVLVSLPLLVVVMQKVTRICEDWRSLKMIKKLRKIISSDYIISSVVCSICNFITVLSMMHKVTEYSGHNQLSVH